MRTTRPHLSAVGAVAVATSLAVTAAVPVAAQDDTGSVVVTTEVLGSVVQQLVGDAAEVSAVMPSGANPHSYEPSARDAEAMLNADVLVSNGLALEEALVSVLEAAAAEGVTWFQAAEHVRVLERDGDDHHAEADHDEDEAHDTESDHDADDHDDHADEDHADDDHADEDHADDAHADDDHADDAHADDDHADEDHADDDHDGHEHGPEDPHIWTDPAAMIDVVTALEPVLADAGIDASAGADALITDLRALDTEVAEIVSAVPEASRQLVTGHESLGYFAERYGFELVGTVIPGLSTSGEPTAREMAQLIEDITDNGVSVVFAEVGTPQAVAEAVASDSGAELVSLSTSQLPEDGTYQDLIRGIATTVADALAE